MDRFEIDLSLERVRNVAERLGLQGVSCSVITVAGTNGKGSTVACLEAIYLAAGYRVGTFTSPYLYRMNEQIKIQGREASDADWAESLEHVRDETLTPFEVTTLQALELFSKANLDVYILEIGLGGRLDAVNIIDADVAIVTSIGIDHVDWLGDTREKIGFEKAGIFRTDKPAICGDFDPPRSLIEHARKIKAPLYCQGKEFGYEKSAETWRWWSIEKNLGSLPLPHLLLQNMTTALMAIELMQEKLSVSSDEIVTGLKNINLPGRIQVLPGKYTTILDVSHNPASACVLADYLKAHPVSGKTRAVFSMLADKDIGATLAVMRDVITEWHIAPLSVPRGASLAVLEEHFREAGIQFIYSYGLIAEAYKKAEASSVEGDLLVVFGSFHTVTARVI